MQKFIISLVISLVTISAFAFDIVPSVTIDNTYHSNVLSLSKDKYDEYMDGAANNYNLETADDFVTGVKVDLKSKIKVFDHSNHINAGINYEKYWINSAFDNMIVSLQTKQYFTKQLDLTFEYQFHPEIYVNRYESVLNERYEDYTYSKNVFDLTFNYDFSQQGSIRMISEYSQLYFNEYFTEYDAKNLENGLRLIYKANKNLVLRVYYGYKISNADAEEAFSDIYFEGVIKDASYEANKYSVSMAVPNAFMINNKAVRWYTSINLEQRFYQSAYDEDTYHYGRDDLKLSASSYLRTPLTKKVRLKLSGKWEQRQTESYFQVVEDDKTFEAYEAGITLEFTI